MTDVFEGSNYVFDCQDWQKITIKLIISNSKIGLHWP